MLQGQGIRGSKRPNNANTCAPQEPGYTPGCFAVAGAFPGVAAGSA